MVGWSVHGSDDDEVVVGLVVIAEVRGDEAGCRHDIIVEEQHELAGCRVDAPIAGGRRAGVLL